MNYSSILFEIVVASEAGRLTAFKKTHDGAVKSCQVMGGFDNSIEFSKRKMQVGDLFVDRDMNFCICIKEIELEASYVGRVNINESREEDLFNDKEIQITFDHYIE